MFSIRTNWPGALDNNFHLSHSLTWFSSILEEIKRNSFKMNGEFLVTSLDHQLWILKSITYQSLSSLMKDNSKEVVETKGITIKKPLQKNKRNIRKKKKKPHHNFMIIIEECHRRSRNLAYRFVDLCLIHKTLHNSQYWRYMKCILKSIKSNERNSLQ